MWGYMFSLPGSSRSNRRRISESGFATKREAEDAEARRRIEEQRKLDLANASAGTTMIHGQDHEAALRWDNFRERNALPKPVGNVE